MESPWRAPTAASRASKHQQNRPISATNPPSPPWLIIVYEFEVTYRGSPLIHRCTHAIHFCAFGLFFPPRRFGGIGGQPGIHRRQPGRRVRRGPVPGAGRQMWRPCRPFLLPVAEFRGSNGLPAGGSRRNNRHGSRRWPKLQPSRLHRIRRHYLSALRGLAYLGQGSGRHASAPETT